MIKLKFMFSLLLFLFSGIQFTGLNYVNDVYSQEIDESGLSVETPFQIQIKRDITFASNGEIIVGDITAMSVDDNDNVFIADRTQTQIHVFSKNGNYIKSLGREGKGPGDFSALTFNTTMAIFSKQLFVTDTFLYFPHRANVFSLEDLTFSYTMNLIPENLSDYKMLKGHVPKQILQQNDNTFLVSYHHPPYVYKDNEGSIYYVLINSENNIISKPILKQKDRTNLTYLVEGEYSYLAIRSFPFFGKSLIAISENDHLYVARSEKFKIDVYDPNGDYISTFRHPFNNKAFNKSKLLDHYKKTNFESALGDGVALKMIRQADNLPETWPALEEMFFDDENRLWVSTIVDDTEVYEWWLLDSSGKILTKFKWPRDKPIQQIRNEYLYTKEKDQDGADIVVRYSFDLENS